MSTKIFIFYFFLIIVKMLSKIVGLVFIQKAKFHHFIHFSSKQISCVPSNNHIPSKYMNPIIYLFHVKTAYNIVT